MPKIKTHSGAKKRFKLTKTGKVKRAHAFKSHILNKKTTKRKRNLRKVVVADVTNVAKIKKMIIQADQSPLPNPPLFPPLFPDNTATSAGLKPSLYIFSTSL